MSSQKQHQQESDHHHQEAHISETDLDILRKLSISNGGFSQPGLLLDRLHELTMNEKTQTDLLRSPSTQLLRILHPDTSHRKLIWAFVLGIPVHSSREIKKPDVPEMSVEHRDERQVELDINRSFVYYPQQISDPMKIQLRETLQGIIVRILRRFPKMNYFQGYHDIVSIFLLNFLDLEQLSLLAVQTSQDQEKVEDDGSDVKIRPVEIDQDLRLLEETVQKFSLHRIRDSLTSDLSPIMGYLRITQAILAKEKPDFATLISQTSSLPLFSLSWILTLTSHDLTSLDVVSRIFDFLLCHPPVMICYLACAICLTKTEEVEDLVAQAQAEGTEIDLDMVHFVMSSLPPLTMDSPDESRCKAEAEPRDQKRTPDQDQALEPDQSEDSTDIDRPTEDQAGAASVIGDERQVEEGHGRNKAGVSIEQIIRSALALYEAYPPTDPRLKLDTIMGPMSCIHTWADSRLARLSDHKAHEILDSPLDRIVRPAPPHPRLGSRKKLVSARSKFRFSLSKFNLHLKKMFKINQSKHQFLFLSTSVLIALLALRLYSLPSSSSSSSSSGQTTSVLSFLLFFKPNHRASLFDAFFSLQDRLSSLFIVH
ncbi:hypothetical protein PGT21_020848 [Puccinia graminis f. sp. tritici]|uniref:Rab-GAP TBC domain-containing protein n=2 Tax=Puccinia graminis f. sp. tritici TaxID=56615 RepID=A0A5B0P0Z8_PUCGR|nr:hypothetical protein PGTUg99_001874 [Puccinia graminis f. sp. tritici]KAA1094424.1 hypothetical protein PGT21_020848 [Puccinia graminis f. sp. tritici]